MTCIVAIKTKTNVVIGCDSMRSSWSVGRCTAADAKYVKHNNIIYAAAGLKAIMNRIRFDSDLESIAYDPKKEPLRFISVDLVPKIRAALKEIDTTEKGRQLMDGSMLIAFGKHLFTLDCVYGPSECADYWADGSGEQVALGVLYATKGQKPEKRIRTALEAASFLSQGVGPPFVLVKT